MFRGATQITLDAKGRLAVPARYRDRLAARCAGHLICTVDQDHCLLIYPLPDWEEIERKLLSQALSAIRGSGSFLFHPASRLNLVMNLLGKLLALRFPHERQLPALLSAIDAVRDYFDSLRHRRRS